MAWMKEKNPLFFDGRAIDLSSLDVIPSTTEKETDVRPENEREKRNPFTKLPEATSPAVNVIPGKDGHSGSYAIKAVSTGT